MIKLFRKLFFFALEKGGRVRSFVYRLKFVGEVELLWAGQVKIGRCKMNVPVRGVGTKGTIEIGDDVTFGFPLATKVGNGGILIQPREPDSKIVIGPQCYFSNNVTLGARSEIIIGCKLLCGDRVSIFDSDYHVIDPEHRRDGPGATRPVRIGDNVWIGSNVMILKGVTIGSHSIIAAGSVVVRDVPPRSVAGGVPAKVLRSI